MLSLALEEFDYTTYVIQDGKIIFNFFFFFFRLLPTRGRHSAIVISISLRYFNFLFSIIY